MLRALIIGGTGLVGSAVARRLLAGGWRVDLTGRDAARLPLDVAQAGGRFIAAERGDHAQLRAAFGDGADLLADCICYTAADAAMMLPFLPDVSSAVMISSKAVYVDAAGNHSNSDVPPRFDGPVSESQPTMAPGDGDYNTREGYGRNKVAAEQVLLDSGYPVTVLRPSKIHGRGARQPREWVFVKRVLDRRPVVVLARRGAGTDHTTAAANIAALIQTVAAVPGCRVLNSADPDAPSGLGIARTVAAQLGHSWQEVLLDGTGPQARPAAAPGARWHGLGGHPWDVPYPIVLDMSAAAELGYVPAGDYASTVADEISWLVSIAGSGGQLPPWLDGEYFQPMFDYDAEDRYLSEIRGTSP